MTIRMAFSVAVLKLRNEKKLSQLAVAEAGEMSVSGYTKIEHGKRMPTEVTIQNLCAGLNITVSELFYEIADSLNVQEFKEKLERDNKPE